MRSFSRWVAGLIGDRIGAYRVVLAGLVPALVGAGALAISQRPAAIVAGAVLYGVGFGAVLNGTYMRMLEQVPRTRYGVVSTLWSLGFDGALAVGGLLLGLLATSRGYRSVFGALPVPLAAALVLTICDRGKPRPIGVTDRC